MRLLFFTRFIVWGEIKANAAHAVQTHIEKGRYSPATRLAKTELQTSLELAENHGERLPGATKDAATSIANEICNINSRDIDTSQLTTIQYGFGSV